MTCNVSHIHAYHDAELPAGERAAVDAHLAACGECAELLADLRRLSQLVSDAPITTPDVLPMGRYYGAWHKSRQTGLLKISSWLTAAAAAVLAGSLLLYQPVENKSPVARAPDEWERVAITPAEQNGERADELVQLAQWMADDISLDSNR